MPDPSLGRRRFFRWLARESVFQAEEMRGVLQRKIEDIPALPPAELASIVPGIVDGVRILPRDSEVWAAPAGNGREAVKLFGDDRAALSLFNQFNGRTTIGAAAARLGEIMDWPAERSFGVTRAFFLHLVRIGVCVPVNLPVPVPSGDEKGANHEPQEKGRIRQ